MLRNGTLPVLIYSSHLSAVKPAWQGVVNHTNTVMFQLILELMP